jgi:predicted GIY-YIG superfamily endonuclease
LNEIFRSHMDAMEPSFKALLEMVPISGSRLPSDIPLRGIYLFSDGDRHLYVGRSNRIRKRLQDHCRPSSGHNSATFAFRIARKETGILEATYSKKGSRVELEKDPEFGSAFQDAKARVRTMNIRYIEENEPMRQALLEMYVALSLETPYNDFDNH